MQEPRHDPLNYKVVMTVTIFLRKTATEELIITTVTIILRKTAT